jgi:hypothetical protein
MDNRPEIYEALEDVAVIAGLAKLRRRGIDRKESGLSQRRTKEQVKLVRYVPNFSIFTRIFLVPRWQLPELHQNKDRC